ncbi:MAG: alpha/beta fold hydrolase [Chloroflexota bacterium]
MPFATTPDGIKLYYETFGIGDPFLLVAGQGTDHHGWDEVIKDFAEDYQIIVYDHRGTGQSDKPVQPPYSTRGFAQDAVAILDHLSIDRAHIYGISMGGRICQWLAIDYPERVGAVILGCTTPGNAHGVRRPQEIDALMIKGEREALRKTLVSPAWMKLHPKILEKWNEQEKNPIPEHAQRNHYLASENHNAWDALSGIKTPTLIIHGSEDKINMTENAFLMMERIPNAELQIIKGGRHLFFIEFQEEASRVVLDFLSRHPMTRRN